MDPTGSGLIRRVPLPILPSIRARSRLAFRIFSCAVLAHPHVVDTWLVSTARAVIVKPVDERTRAKTSINELLRD